MNSKLRRSTKTVYIRKPSVYLRRFYRPEKRQPLESPKLRSMTPRRTPQKQELLDSSFSKSEAETIMNELRYIRSPKIWKKVVTSFQSKPTLLLDLIPLKSPQKKKFFVCRKNKEKEVPELHTPEDYETWHDENDKKYLTEDWKKSMLYFNLRKSPVFVCEDGYSHKELCKINRKLPSEQEELKEVHRKAMNTLDVLLVELLGTKKDVSRFHKRFSIVKPSAVKALISKCLDMFTVRNLTADLLLYVIARERMIRKLPSLVDTELKDTVVAVYELSDTVRIKIENWLKSTVVPFDAFVFNGKNYLDKLTEDNVFLVSTL